MHTYNYQILPWDSDFFGFKVASVIFNDNTPTLFDSLMKELKEQSVKLVYFIAPVNNNDAKEMALKWLGNLVDLKTTYSINLIGSNIQFINNQNITKYKKNQATEQLLNLSVQCGKYSRFAIDTKIPRTKMIEMYKIWVENSINKKMADDIIVYTLDDIEVGLVTVYTKANIGNIGLIGVDENYRGKGIGGALIQASYQYFLSKNISMLEVVTQGENKAACALYEKYGFAVKDQIAFYHIWL